MKSILNTEEGFTLLEALIALMLSSLIIVLLTGGILQTRKMNEVLISDAQNLEESSIKILNDRQIEFHLFLNQFEMYLQGSINPNVSKNFVEIQEWDEPSKKYERVRYHIPFTNTRNFTRVKNGGNHRMLTEMKTISLERNGGWLNVEVTFLNLEKYTGRIWVESWLEKETENKEEVGTD